MKGILGFILLVIGLVNITTENLSLLGWIATIAGVVFLALALSGSFKKRRVGGGLGASADYSTTKYGSDSDFSGGDGGGGGE